MRALALLIFSLSLCGCSASLQTRLKEAQPPSALVLPDKALAEKDRVALFEAHRAYVNDLGVQVGRRHFDAGRLPQYFRESGKDEFAERAQKALWDYWADEKKKGMRRYRIRGNLEDIGSGTTPDLGVGYALLVFLPVNLMGLVAHEAWAVRTLAEIGMLKLMVGGEDTLRQVVHDYNLQLMRDLGVQNPEIRVAKTSIDAWPATPRIGVNATEDDWRDEYRLGDYSGKWYLGYQRCSLETASDLYNGGTPILPPVPTRGQSNMFAAEILGGLLMTVAAATLNRRGGTSGSEEWKNTLAISLTGGLTLTGAAFVARWKAAAAKSKAISGFNKRVAERLFANQGSGKMRGE